MFAAEAEARVAAVEEEKKLRIELMREEMKLKMELLREESAARRDALRDDVANLAMANSSSEVSRESSRVPKRKRVSAQGA